MKNFIVTLSFLLIVTAGGAGAKDSPAKKSPKQSTKVKQLKKSLPNADAGAAVAFVSLSKGLQPVLNNWLLSPPLRNSSVAVEVMDAGTQRVLAEINGRRRFVPASSIKALTCACAYDLLGPEFTFKTKIATNGTVINGVLEGDLLILSGEDPTFNRGDLYSLLEKSLTEVSAKQINGRIILVGCQTGFSSVWLVEDWGRNWMPVSSSVVLDRNCLALNTLPQSWNQTERISISGSLFDKALNSKDGPSWIFVERNNTGVQANFISAMSNKLAPFIVSNPNEYVLALAETHLKDKGFTLQNRNLNLSSKLKDLVILSEKESKPLSNILQWTLHESDNLYAQQVLRTLGAMNLDQSTLDAASMSSISLEEKGISTCFKWLSGLKVGAQEVVMFDGCGLSRKNGISPHALNTVISYMNQKQNTRPFFNLLKAEQGKGAASSYRFKTGTMETVRCISGLLTTNSGQKLAVTIMINGHTPSVRNLRITVSDLITKLKNSSN